MYLYNIMNEKKQIPRGYKPYKTIEGKFAAHIGPYFFKTLVRWPIFFLKLWIFGKTEISIKS